MPSRFKHQEVRELAWLIASPPLFVNQNVLSEFECQSEFNNCLEWLNELDQYPNPLIEHLSERTSSRLGFRFEALLAFWINNRSQSQIVKQNWQLIINKKTLGEIDFIVKTSQGLEHWEAAMKFYLAYEGKWYGPNSIDRLDIKSDLLLNKQLKISNNPLVKPLLSEAHIEIKQSRTWAKGILFNHAKENYTASLPAKVNANCVTGTWCYLSEFSEFSESGAWKIVDHNSWMDPYPVKNHVRNKNLFDPLKEELTEKESVMLLQQIGTNKRKWFVVNENWPKNIK